MTIEGITKKKSQIKKGEQKQLGIGSPVQSRPGQGIETLKGDTEGEKHELSLGSLAYLAYREMVEV